MQLFKRIIQLVEVISGGNVSAFCRKLSIRNTTLTGYMNEQGQEKVRHALLIEILNAYPQINRDWLFFDEGEMFVPGFRMGMRMGNRVEAVDKPVAAIATPVADAVREVETGLRRAGAEDTLVWGVVERLARDKAGPAMAREKPTVYAQEPPAPTRQDDNKERKREGADEQ